MRPSALWGLLAGVALLGGAQGAGAAPRFRWTQLQPAQSPPPTYGHGMAYDPVRKRVVMFGGIGNDALCCQVPSADLWEWDGVTWTPVEPAVKPTPRAMGALAFDPTTGKMVAFGGVFDLFKVLDETWQWDGASWAKIDKQPFPGLDPTARGRTVAFGADAALGLFLLAGVKGDGSLEGGVMYNLAGGTWGFLSETVPPQADMAALWSPVSQQAFAFGGRACSKAGDPGCAGSSKMYTWAPTTKVWSEVPVASGPGARWGATMTLHGPSSKAILVGGRDGAGPTGEVWSFDLTLIGGWELLATSPAPPQRSYHGAAWDESRKQLVVFGGSASANELFEIPKQTILGDTWVLDQIGQGCAGDGECSTGHCVDGVCCEAVCGVCQTCNAAGLEGYCTTVVEAADPDSCATTCDVAGACPEPKKNNGAACAQGSECQAGNCVDGVCCAQAACSVCLSCALPGSEGQCSLVLNAPDPDSCATTCDGAGFCAGAPKGQPGDPCSGGAACEGGLCVDGVCCMQAACGVCETCAAPGTAGQCAPVVDAVDADSCPAGCDAAGKCASATRPDGEVCAVDGECASGHCAASSGGRVCCAQACDEGPCQACDGGVCQTFPGGSPPLEPGACGSYSCTGFSPLCEQVCADAFPCLVGVCKNSRCASEQGASCNADAECATGHCVDDICCDTGCDGSCEACTVAKGAAVDGVCAPRTCDAGQVCIDGKGCIDPASLSPIGGPCQFKDGCADAGATCLAGRCCDLAADKTCGLSCSADGRSVVDGINKKTSPCPAGQPCFDGYCLPPPRCSAVLPCPTGFACGSDGRCAAVVSAQARKFELATPIGCVCQAPGGPVRGPGGAALAALTALAAGLGRRRARRAGARA